MGLHVNTNPSQSQYHPSVQRKAQLTKYREKDVDHHRAKKDIRKEPPLLRCSIRKSTNEQCDRNLDQPDRDVEDDPAYR